MTLLKMNVASKVTNLDKLIQMDLLMMTVNLCQNHPLCGLSGDVKDLKDSKKSK